MLRRNFTMPAGIILVSGLLASPAFSADFHSKYYDLPLTNDWMAQKVKDVNVPAGGDATLFASNKFGEGVLITVMPSDVPAKDAADKMAQSYKQQGMRIIAGPVQIPGQNSYRFTYVSANKKMRAITFVTSNGKNLSQISVLGRQGTQGTYLLKGLKPKEEGLFPKL